MAESLEALIGQLNAKQDELRAQAAERLAHLEHEAQGAALALVRASVDPADEVRDWAVAALEGIGAPRDEDLEELTALVADPRADIGYWAVTLLGRSGAAKPPIVAAIAGALSEHAAPAVRRRCAWALEKLDCRDEVTKRALGQAAECDDRAVAAAARGVLDRWGGGSGA